MLGEGEEMEGCWALFYFSLGSRPRGEGLVRELRRMDWSALLWTSETLSLRSAKLCSWPHASSRRKTASLRSLTEILRGSDTRQLGGFMGAAAHLVLTVWCRSDFHALDILLYWMLELDIITCVTHGLHALLVSWTKQRFSGYQGDQFYFIWRY